MDKYDKNYIIDLLSDIIGRFEYYSYLDEQEKKVYDILEEARKKIKAVKIWYTFS